MSIYRVIRLTLYREIWLASFYIRYLWNVVNHLRVTILLYIIVSSWKLITKLLIVLVSENCLCNSSLPPLVYTHPSVYQHWKRWWHQLVNQWPKYFYLLTCFSQSSWHKGNIYERLHPCRNIAKNVGFGGCS